jgi:hypothetical protein
MGLHTHSQLLKASLFIISDGQRLSRTVSGCLGRSAAISDGQWLLGRSAASRTVSGLFTIGTYLLDNILFSGHKNVQAGYGYGRIRCLLAIRKRNSGLQSRIRKKYLLIRNIGLYELPMEQPLCICLALF